METLTEFRIPGVSYGVAIEVISGKDDLFAGLGSDKKLLALERWVRHLAIANALTLGRGVQHLARNILVTEVAATRNSRVARVYLSVEDIPPHFVDEMNRYILQVAVAVKKEAPNDWELRCATTVIL